MWSIEAGQGRIVIRPSGHLRFEESSFAADEFELAIDELEEPCVLIIDLLGLTGYESEVRKIWQEVMRRCSPRVRAVVWVSDKPMFRMVAASVSLFTGIPGRVVGSHQDPLKFAI